MNIRIVAAAGALALASLGLAPASAQMPPPNGMHQDHGGPGGPGMGGPGMGGGDHRGGPDGAVRGRGPGMDHRPDMRGDHGRRDGWKRTSMKHRKHCSTVWRDHRRVKRCR